MNSLEPHVRRWTTSLLAFTCFVLALPLEARPTETSGLDSAEIEQTVEGLEGREDRDEAAEQALARYREALELIEQAAAAREDAADFERLTAAAPAAIERLSAEESEALPDEMPPEDATALPLEELTAGADRVTGLLAEARAEADAHAEETKDRAVRLGELPDRLSEVRAALAALPARRASLASAPEPKRSERTLNRARRQLLEAQLEALEAEQKYLEATPTLFATRAGIFTRQVDALAAAAEAWQRLVDRRRSAATNEAVRRAREDVRRYADVPGAAELAVEVADLAERHAGEDGLTGRMAEAAAERLRLEETAARVTTRFAGAKRRVNLLEEADLPIDQATGQLLRTQRQDLPEIPTLRARLRQVILDSARAQIDLIALEDRQAEIIAARNPADEESPAITELREARLEALRKLIEDTRAYLGTLTATTTVIRDLIDEVTDFALFVDERLLWIPSSERLGVDEFQLEGAALRELFAGRPFDPLVRDARRNPFLWAFFLLVAALLMVTRRRHRKLLKAYSAEARKRSCTSYVPTARALLVTILLAAPLPVVAWLVYARSGGCPDGVALGLRNLAAFLSSTLLLSSLARPEGLLVDHFRMEGYRAAVLRKALRWFIPAAAPLVFFATVLPLEIYGSSAGRLFFIGLLAVLMAFFIITLKPSRELIHWRGRPGTGLAKACFALGIVLPLALMIGAGIGFYASVQELWVNSLRSIGVILQTLFVAALLYRWILVSRRRFAVQQAMKRRAAVHAERSGTDRSAADTPQNSQSLAEVKATSVKPVEVEEQTSRLVRAGAIAMVIFGLWGIWAPTIPAMSAFNRVTLWTESTPATPAEPAAAEAGPADALTNPLNSVPAATALLDDTPNVVTLQDLFTAIIALVLTFVAARNIPGLLELTIFRHLKLALGTSFALTTTIRYLLVVVGLVIAFGMIGITWGKVQWIAAAITLGIGFGLQEIFANFVAGLIILFERPIRLGDIVTVAGVDGKVTQIRIRATTIRQFNNRELIVPNKEFITGQLVNWTLSDAILRLEVPVGIAYGSDTMLARDLLLKVADEHPKVIADPPPHAIFESFGDSSLLFILRANVGSVADLLQTKSELHLAVDKAFREAGIEIAFPQTDIHIRSLPVKAEQSEQSELRSTEADAG